MKTFANRLLGITQGCRYDMHEPDEQNLTARIVGDHLDNACCEHISIEAIEGKFQEFVIILERVHDQGIHREKFNLATLIALARIGAKTEGLKDF